MFYNLPKVRENNENVCEERTQLCLAKLNQNRDNIPICLVSEMLIDAALN